VASAVAGIVEPTLQLAETARSASRSTTELTAYDLYLRALAHSLSYEKEGVAQALDLLRQVIEKDPLTVRLSPWRPIVTKGWK
jgi:hypothetical protein